METELLGIYRLKAEAPSSWKGERAGARAGKRSTPASLRLKTGGQVWRRKATVMWQFFTLIISFLLPFLRDKSAANAVEYALIMALVAVFIIAGIIIMSGVMGALFATMGECLDDPALCTPDIFEELCTVAHRNCGNK